MKQRRFRKYLCGEFHLVMRLLVEFVFSLSTFLIQGIPFYVRKLYFDFLAIDKRKFWVRHYLILLFIY